MNTIINNEGKKVVVPAETYSELKQSYNEGVWSAIIKVNGEYHSVVLTDNFHA